MLASGSSRGIFSIWNKRVVECIDEAMGTFSISCKFKSVMDQLVWAFSRVYGPYADFERQYLWEELSGVQLVESSLVHQVRLQRYQLPK